jgi:glyoxylase-like metal-dependent hydrolase (beta-lactamase superfamily II)
VMRMPDDPTGDWTEPGVYEVTPGVHRIPLPLPSDGLKAVNVYAVEDDDGLVLIDSGWAITEARDRLQKALAALGYGVRDVRRFLVTHIHRDHYTLAVALRRDFGNRVSLGIGERPTLERTADPNTPPLGDQLDQLDRYGAEPVAARLRALISRDFDRSDWEAPDDWLVGPADVPLASRSMRVLPTPGHTRGHVVFVDSGAGLLFAGDHVLPHITPSIGFEADTAELPLADYLGSLRLVRDLPDLRLLPAHGPVAASVHARVDELLAHHRARLDTALAAVAGGAATAYDAACGMSWTRRARAFADLDLFNQMLAVIETGAHLDLLVAQARLTRQDLAGVRHYALPDRSRANCSQAE